MRHEVRSRRMQPRSVLWCAALSVFACSCSSVRPRTPAPASPQSALEAAIRDTEQKDPGSPALLDARLAYAAYLLTGAQGSSCIARLNRAQEEIGSVDASPERQVMYPDGWAVVSDLEYRQHLARAGCDSEADRRDDLLAALEAARRAVELHRRAFNYHAMVIMQFDEAITLRRLDEKAAALAALAETLRMDREYGFRDDARENCRLLLTWRGQPAGAAQIARLMRDFPERRTTLKFGWHASDARVTLERRRANLSAGQIAHSRAAAAYERRITAAPGGGWEVSYVHPLSGYQPGVWPSDPSSHLPRLVFPPAPLPALDFKVSPTGDFEGVTDPKAFATRLTAVTDGLIRARAPADADGRSATSDAVESTAVAFSPGMLEAEAAENYQLETAMWIGATLEQGVWYGMSAPLALPGMPHFVLAQRIAFAFTRFVPCSAGAATESCVEVVIHATPDRQALDNLLADLTDSSAGNGPLGYAASTDARIVLDPATLLSYAREERIHWYFSLGKSADQRVVASDHLWTTTRYEVN